MKRVIIVIMVLSLLFSIGCGPKETIVGGDRDEHNCIGSAGYSWDEDIGACVRSWEIKTDEQRVAAKAAVEKLDDMPGITIVEVVKDNSTDEYVVKTTTDKQQDYKITVSKDEVSEPVRVMSTNWCDDKSGTARNSCEGREIDIGLIEDLGKRCCIIPN